MTDTMLYTGICFLMYLPSNGLLSPVKNNNIKNKRITEDCLFLAVALVITDLGLLHMSLVNQAGSVSEI